MKVEIFFSRGERVILDNLPPDSTFLKGLYDENCFDTAKVIQGLEEGKIKKTHFLNMQQVWYIITTPDDTEKTVLVKEEEEAYEESHDNDNSTGFFDRVLSFFSR